MKMVYGSYGCEVSVADNFSFCGADKYDYERDTVRYAVCRFLAKSEKFCKEFTRESWQIRIAKGKDSKKHRFTYVIPAVLMELPSAWVRLTGEVTAVGVNVYKVELFEEYPLIHFHMKEK